MSVPTASIVIVNWKTPALLAKCLDTIAKDSGAPGFEIWVVDNNSQDGSVEMLEKQFPHVKLVANKDNVGFSKACNQVIPLCTAPYVLLLNPDTEVVGDAISVMAKYLDEHPQCASVGGKVLNPDGSLQLACRRAFPSLAASFYRVTYLSRLFPNHPEFSKYNLTRLDPNKECEVDALSGSCMMSRRQVIDAIGLLDEDIFMFGEDIDWCWRMKQAGWTINYLPTAVVYHVHGASSRLRPIGATINLHKGMEVFYRKHLAQKYWAPVNGTVYAAIWTRAILFILINWLKGFANSSSIRQETSHSQSDEEEALVSGNLTRRSGN